MTGDNNSFGQTIDLDNQEPEEFQNAEGAIYAMLAEEYAATC